MKKLLWIVVSACVVVPVAGAQEKASRAAGDWLVRVGGTYIAPKSNNNAAVDVDEAFGFTFNGTYMFSSNIGLELLAAMPYEHDLNDTATGEKIGSTNHLPPTLTAQWHFNPIGRLIPYVGLGINYTLFFDEQLVGGRLSLDESWGLAGQLGFDWGVGTNWFLNLDLRYIGIETDARVNGVNIGTVEIDPWVAGLNVGWTF
ncbi:MAG: outer membrane beta-barrel protein [Gammaproteobacteria bacterium]|nr:outer membrane beta-barrel protein [Gammaproteobacteria bacterium]